jgi:ribosome-binding protein aMBF1 (putative translation factor)
MIVPVKKRIQSDALRYAYDRFVGSDPALTELYEQELGNIDVARSLYDLRTKAGLSQRELAKKVGTTASVICRLEDADYEGHSLSMLKRIAAALNSRVEIRFVPVPKQPSSTRPRPKAKAG